MTVLVVDDEVTLAELLQDQLEDHGHSCLTARDVDEAEWTLQNVDVDAMAVDLDTGGRPPLEWLEQLGLAQPELTRATVVISGHDPDPEEVLRVRACGATILTKPFPIQELHAAILDRIREKTSPRDREEAAEERVPRRPVLADTSKSEN